MTDQNQDQPGVGNLLLGYGLLGLQPLAVAFLARAAVGAPEAVFARFAISAFLLTLICLVRRRGLTSAQPGVLLLRGVLGGAAVLLYFTSIQEAGAARGTLLNYTYPIWANLFGWFLGYRPPSRFWFGLALALVGVYFVIVPAGGWGGGSLGRGELAGLLSGLLAGGAVLTIKKLRETDDSLSIIASFTFFGLIISLPFAEIGEVQRLGEPQILPFTLAVGATAFLGHVFFTRGYAGVSVPIATLLSLLVPLVAAVSGALVLGERMTGRLLGGAALILVALVLAVRRPQSQRGKKMSAHEKKSSLH